MLCVLSRANTKPFPDQVIGPRGILASKARILVTNSVAFTQYFDHIVYLRRGIIVEQGPYTSLAANSEGELFKLMYVTCLSLRMSIR